MRSKKFVLDQIPEVDFDIHYSEIDAESTLNHNESHIHKECEIYLNLSGDVVFEVENHIYPVSRGSVIITRPYEYHHCIYRSNCQHRHYWITFSADQSEALLKMFFDREKGKDNLIILDGAKLGEFCEILEELLEEGTDPLLRRIDFLRMFHILKQGTFAEEIGILEELPEDVKKVMEYIEEHLTEDITIQVLADVGGVSINTLERHFKEFFHMTPHAVLRKKRLLFSMRCLREGESVSNAAMKSGFTDYSNYIQLSRKEFGMTPLKYKQSFIL